jgi:hypothetical protein
MSERKNINMVRGFGYMAGVLGRHQSEPLCGMCKSYVKTAGAVREALSGFEKSTDVEPLPGEMKGLYSDARKQLLGLSLPEEPVPQRKLGNCVLDGKCFLKYPKIFFEMIEEEKA